MARAHVKEGKLRGCPTCGTKVAEVDIGLRDFAWVNEALPGKLGLMDLDGCITQAATGRGLFLELKPHGAFISRGARLTFALLVSKGFEVWFAWDEGDGWVTFAPAREDGAPGRRRRMKASTLARKVRHWWDEGVS